MRFAIPQPTAHALRRAHFWLLLLWLAMVPIALVFGLLESVAFVAAASIYANAAAHWAAWQGSRAEEESE
jgi:hypothetical protein